MNCDPLARWYRWMEYAGMGRALERRRFEFLAATVSARRVLILGEGDGRFLTAFLHVNTHAHIDVVDNSAKMIAIATSRACGRHGADAVAHRVQFHQADARLWSLRANTVYDLIVTHFFCDCFTLADLSLMIQRFSAATTEDCQWIVSEFRQPARGFAAWRARFWISTLYRLFGWTTGLRVRQLPAYGMLLEKNGFEKVQVVTAEMGLLTSEVWQRPRFFAIDAPASTPLHSRTPKS